MRLRREHVPVLIRLTCTLRRTVRPLPERSARLEGLTNNTGEAIIPGDRLAVVAFPSLERLREIDGGLLLLALQVELVDAALGNH